MFYYFETSNEQSLDNPAHPLLTSFDNSTASFLGHVPFCSEAQPMRHEKDLGDRKKPRVQLGRRGFIIPTPGAAWIECIIVDVSDSGVCLDVGALVVGSRSEEH